jgi:dihydrofolate reductase
MRKLIYGINLTLDGCCDHTKGSANEEIHDYFTDQMRQAGVLLYGRITYELMVPFWPQMAKDGSAPTKALADFAQAFDAVPRIVVCSRTLGNMNDGKTTIISNNLREEILKLKQEAGKDIMLGGVDVPGQLMQMDLVDEYRIVIQPHLAGAGRRLFDNVPLAEKLDLKLVDKHWFESGGVALHYAR